MTGVCTKNSGFTIIELAIATAVSAIVLLVAFGLLSNFSNAWDTLEAQIETQRNARGALEIMANELRKASITSVANLANLPADIIVFSIPEDLDGNGTPLDAGDNIEWGPQITFQRDPNDPTRIIRTKSGNSLGVAHAIMPDEDANGNGVLDPGEDSNGNGRLDRGLLFDIVLNEDVDGNGVLGETEDTNDNGKLDVLIRISIDTSETTDVTARTLSTSMSTMVSLRS